MSRRAVLLVDGEHHPPVVRAAIASLADEGTEPVAVVVVGGGEKLADPERAPELGAPTSVPERAEAALPAILADHRPDVVVDLSGDPVVVPTRRHALAAITLAAGVSYEAPGWRVDPPPLPLVPERPVLAVFATGKRTGKTAVSGALTRHTMREGRTPTIVAMGRGGPPDPVVLEAGTELSTDRLLEVVAAGGHAASDFYEDAVTTGARTVGCFRVGDGPAGEVAHTNVSAGVDAALEGPGDLLVLEGSGAALPPVRPDAAALIVPATGPPRDLAAGLHVRLLLADVVLLTFAGRRSVAAAQRTAVETELRQLIDALPAAARPNGGSPPPVVATDFRPRPLGDVAGRRVALITTAPAPVTDRIARRLERAHDAEVVASSGNLADRPRLRADLERVPDVDAVVVELKAAAVDVVMRWAADRGAEVVVLDHELVPADPGGAEMAEQFDRLVRLADGRADRS